MDPISTRVSRKPGNGYPYDSAPKKSDPEYRGKPFPSTFVHIGYDDEYCWMDGVRLFQPITFCELTMLQFMNTVTDKPGWTTKVFDETIIAKWEQESVRLANSTIKTEMTETMFAYCISELQHRALEHPNSPNGAIRVFNGDVYKSDTAVSDETKLALQKAVRVLEDVPDSQKDWHPGSDGKVLDLVHPSLFPLVYGTSKVLPIGAPVTTLEDCIKRCGEGDVVYANTSNPVAGSEVWSDKFQWLPCEVDIMSGEKPRILTYINNLHPERHRELYGLVEDVIHASIPLWEETVIPTKDLRNTPRRIEYTSCTYDPDPETWPMEDQIQPEEGEDGDDFMDRRREWIMQTRVVVRPEPPEGFQPHVLRRNLLSFKDQFGALPLQVIMKLLNIELTPEKPEYGGGTWHVEGMRNESICATAIYYYSSENITPSSLAFLHDSIQKSSIAHTSRTTTTISMPCSGAVLEISGPSITVEPIGGECYLVKGVKCPIHPLCE